MQAFLLPKGYPHVMSETTSRLRVLRQRAGLSMRQLAQMIGVDHSNLRFWEQSGKTPRSELLPAIAEALGVSIEELLGIEKTSKQSLPNGKARQTFERLSNLPRGQQKRILEVVDALVTQHENKEAS